MEELEHLEWRISLIQSNLRSRRERLACIRALGVASDYDLEAADWRVERMMDRIKALAREEKRVLRAIEYEKAVRAGPWC